MRVELVILCPTCTQLLLGGTVAPGAPMAVHGEEAEVILGRSIDGEGVESDRPWVFVTEEVATHPHPVAARLRLVPEPGVDY